MSKKYILVRAMNRDVFLQNNVVAVGWSEVDLSQYPDESKFSIIQKKYPSFNSKYINAINRFCSLKAGDIVIVPVPEAIRIARVKTGKLVYSNKDIKYDQANQIEVEYITDNILRKDLRGDFQRRLRVRGYPTLDLSEFRDQIEELIQNPQNTAKQYWINVEIKQAEHFKKTLLKKIQDCSMFMESNGNGLEELIRDMMELKGYVDCRKCAKNEHPGKADADIIATDPFLDRKIFIQAKHHRGETGEWGIKQLEELRKAQGKLDNNEDYILWTTAVLTDEAHQFAAEKGIMIKTGEDLVELIYELLNRLPKKWLVLLGISDVPMLID